MGWRRGWAIPSVRAPFGAAGQVAHNDLTVAVLRHVRIGNKLSVARDLRRLDRMPRVVILMGERLLWRGLAVCMNERSCQQGGQTNRPGALSRASAAAFHNPLHYYGLS